MSSSKTELTLEYLSSGYMCSEAMLAPYAEQAGLPEDVALKIAGGFAGGMAQGKTCGAVTGGFIVLGLLFGAGTSKKQYSRELCFQLVQEYTHRFEERRSTIECEKILAMNGVDFHNPDDMKTLRTCGLCDKVVRDASEVLEELLAEYEGEAS